MPKLTEKENYLRMLRGEVPQWVPQYNYFRAGAANPPTMLVDPAISNPHRVNQGGLDAWGVNWVPTYETAGGLIPEPNNFLLADVTNWRDVIHAPDTAHVDWDKLVADDVKRYAINRDETATALCIHFGYFQTLVSFMGFENAMMAMYEEPEAVHELLDYVAEFVQVVALGYIDRLKPDVLTLQDDTAAWGAPFISPAMYREFLLPRHKLFTALGVERGLPITMHNCGKCEGIVDQLVEMGVTLWEPAQTCNDLAAIKASGKIMIAGGWDAGGRLLEPDVTDEEIRQSVRDTMDKLAPNGGFAWFGGFMGPLDDAEMQRHNAVLLDEAERYGRVFYN
ncbi:MAG: veratrol--corrinoid protein metyltransferase [Oscillospiraceae bacterium]|jgi:hypothetical protein|nr:veratrol--corrinoid protein metyltransferase [Oscillospiraceae bacterium]